MPESIVHHRYALRFGPDKTYYQERNRYLMLLKGLRWRTLEGLPTRAPYAHDYLEHTTIETPEEYGWPSLEGES